jgi:hypothetical protein
MLTEALLLFPAQAKADQFQWQASIPESQGMSKPKLDALRASLAAKQDEFLKRFITVEMQCGQRVPAIN